MKGILVKRIAFASAIILLLATSGCVSKNTKNSPVLISTHSKPTILVFDSTSCPYCIKLRKEFKTNSDLSSLLKKFSLYFIHINKNGKYLIETKNGKIEMDTQTLAKTFGFPGTTPYIVFTDKNLIPITIVPGYLRPPTMKKVLKYILTKSYKKMSLEKFISSNDNS